MYAIRSYYGRHILCLKRLQPQGEQQAAADANAVTVGLGGDLDGIGSVIALGYHGVVNADGHFFLVPCGKITPGIG